MRFEDILAVETVLLNEAVSNLSSPQRKVVTGLGRDGWTILAQDGTKVTLSDEKGNRVYVYKNGKTLYLSESVTEEVRSLYESLGEEDAMLLQENIFRSLYQKIRGKHPRMNVYSDGKGAIAIVKLIDGTKSICHVERNRIVYETDNATDEQIKGYLEKHPSYKKLIDKAKIQRIGILLGMLGVSVAVGVSAGFLAFRAATTALVIGRELIVPGKVYVQDKETRAALADRIDNMVKVKSGSIEISDDAFDFSSIDYLSGSTFSDKMANATIVGIGMGSAVAGKEESPA